MAESFWPSSSGGLTQAQTKQAVQDALTAVNATDMLETRFHSAASVGINASSGAWVELGTPTPAALTHDIKAVELTQTIGEPLEIGTGANSGAVTRRFVTNRGEGPLSLVDIMSSGARLWVRSLTTTAVASGEITLNLLG